MSNRTIWLVETRPGKGRWFLASLERDVWHWPEDAEDLCRKLRRWSPQNDYRVVEFRRVSAVGTKNKKRGPYKKKAPK